MVLVRDSIAMDSLAVSGAALYARAVSSRLGPGVPRLAALLPAGGRMLRRGPARLLVVGHPPVQRRLAPRVARHVQARSPRHRPRAAGPGLPRAPFRPRRRPPGANSTVSRREAAAAAG
jgi:hypothetical protein